MKRVLIVDDEPQDLEDLKQMLAPLQGQWETAFAPDGEAALALLSATPFDALVSTVSDRGLDGASLLNKVREKFPTVVRIALAGQKELDAAMRTIRVAHQFLAKPYDPSMLRVAVERATSLSDVLNNKMLASVVGSIKDLPIMPRTYLSLRERMADPEVSVKDVFVLVEKEVGISAKILQLVNSALFGLPREIFHGQNGGELSGHRYGPQFGAVCRSVSRVREDSASAGFFFRGPSNSFAPDRENRGCDSRIGADSFGCDCRGAASRRRKAGDGHARV
jgi:CheY-like chemotaxis protein